MSNNQPAYIIKCVICHTEFIANKASAIICSAKCRKVHDHKMKAVGRSRRGNKY